MRQHTLIPEAAPPPPWRPRSHVPGRAGAEGAGKGRNPGASGWPRPCGGDPLSPPGAPGTRSRRARPWRRLPGACFGLLLGLALGLFGPASGASAGPLGEALASDVGRASDDAIALPKAPLHWGSAEWTRLGIVAGITAAVALTDEDVRDEVLGARSKFTRDLSRVVRGGGDPLGWGGALVATTYVGGLLAGSPAVREVGLEMAEAAFFSAAVVGGLKISVGRSRPDRERGSGSLDFFHGSLDGSRGSFPSQHAAFAFSLASVTAERLPRSGWALYPLAALVALSRVHDDEHWASDVVTGAAIGTAMGLWVAHRPRDGTETSGLTPWAVRGAAGLAWVRPF